MVVTDADALDINIGTFFRLLSNIGGTNGLGQAKEDILFTVTSKDSSGGFTNIHFTPDASLGTFAGDNLHTLRRATADDLPLAYWPCEDLENSNSVASGLIGGAPLTIVSGQPGFGAIDTFPGSAPFMKLNNAELRGTIPNYTNTNQAFTISFLLNTPETDEAATNTDLLVFYTDGTAERWEFIYSGGGGNGNLRLAAVDTPTATVLFDQNWDLHARNTPVVVVLSLRHTAPTTVEYSIGTIRYDANGLATISGPATGTVTGVTNLGKMTDVKLNPFGGGYIETGISHIAIVPSFMEYFNFLDAPKAHKQEEIMRRFNRLPYEEDVPLVYCGGPITGQQMGPQQVDTFLNNLQAAADFDMGRFYEARGAYSFVYAQRSTLYDQPYVLDIDYSAGGVLSELIGTYDDKDTQNDITVTRTGGSSYHVEQTTGRLSVLKPKDGGVGRYIDSKELNARDDLQLPDLANWLLHLGTVYEDRFPSIKLTPASGNIKLSQMLSVGVGNRLKLRNLQARNIYEPIDQLTLGYTLVLDQISPTLEINGEPARPYNTAILDRDSTRLDHLNSLLNEDIDEVDTTFQVTASDSVIWATTAAWPAEFPFDLIVSGERWTCTANVGASNPQTMTVIRSVNGVVKSHLAGTKIELADPVYLPR